MLGNSKHLSGAPVFDPYFWDLLSFISKCRFILFNGVGRGIYVVYFGGPMGPSLGYMNRVLSGMFASLLVQSGVPLPSSISVTALEDEVGSLDSCLGLQRDCYSPAPLWV